MNTSLKLKDFQCDDRLILEAEALDELPSSRTIVDSSSASDNRLATFRVVVGTCSIPPGSVVLVRRAAAALPPLVFGEISVRIMPLAQVEAWAPPAPTPPAA